jgi:hypothetical protein
MSADSINSILDGLSSDFNDLTAAHAFSVIGLAQIPAHLATVGEHLPNPDPVVVPGVNMSGPNTPTSAGWRLSDALTQVERSGPVETRLGHLRTMSLYALWEDEYRPRLAALHGRSPNDESMICWAIYVICAMMLFIIAGSLVLRIQVAVLSFPAGSNRATSYG